MFYGELNDIRIDGVETPLRGFRFTVHNPLKVAVLRLPNSAEITARNDAQKSIRRSLGRRKSQTDPVPNFKADLELFNKIRVDKGLDFDEYEARNAILKITEAEVTGCDRTGDQYVISVRTPFCSTIHTIGIPTAKQLNQYRLTVVNSTELPHNQEELRYRTQSAVDLYDGLSAVSTGYAEGTEVPAHHKFAVVSELVQAIDEFDPPFVPND
jgi:hypothetical protein